jgi:predicted PurR-regulated permease PerM
VLLAFGLVIAAVIFRVRSSLVLGVLVVVIIATPLSAFADFLERWHCARAIGATLGLLLGLGVLAGLVALIVPAFTREVTDFVHSLPSIGASLERRLGGQPVRLQRTSPPRSSTS